MTTLPDPATAAADLWAHLVDWQPATAAALLQQLRALPDDWPLRVFNVGRPDAALALPPGAQGETYDDHAPEIAPYADDAWFEDCPACGERGGNCRYHEGHATGRQELYEPLLAAMKANANVTVRAFLQSLDDDPTA
jgi:hypothetical protein